jgi:penicillin-binding protein 2
VIAPEIAEALCSFCIETVENGTGKEAKPAKGLAGGKTASAQTGIIENGVEQLNVYFTGFYPAENPQYAITVFAENGTSGGGTCGPVFREICDFIAQNNLTHIESVIY